MATKRLLPPYLGEIVIHLFRGECAPDAFEALVDLLDEDAFFRVQGRQGATAVEFERQGKCEVATALGMLRRHYRRHPAVGAVAYSADGGGTLVVRSGHEADVCDQPVTWCQTTLFVLEHGRVVQCWLLPDDLKAFDAWWDTNWVGGLPWESVTLLR